MDDVIPDALDRLRDTGPEYKKFLANHGPMGAEALVQLGRSEEVPRWVDTYKRVLAPAPSVVRGITAEDWHEHLGAPRLARGETCRQSPSGRERPDGDYLRLSEKKSAVRSMERANAAPSMRCP